MKSFLLRVSLVMVALLFLFGSMTPGAEVSSSQSVPEPDIVVRFRGLMVFGEVRSGREEVLLHSRAGEDPGPPPVGPTHKVTVQIKGPGFGDYIEWGPGYGLEANMLLEVKDSDGRLVDNATWVSSDRPFRIALLHPVSQGNSLAIHENVFRPKFTINTGQLYCNDLMSVNFVDQQPQPNQQVYDNIPKEVVATIYLGAGQTAKLQGNHLPDVSLVKVPGQKWEIVVRVSPDLSHVCDTYHFLHYYMGFFRRPDVGPDMVVPERERFTARSMSASSGTCLDSKKFDMRAIPDRPCIPISY